MSTLAASIDDLRQNDRQWAAFTTTGHVVVMAPPGSGKTKLLATRIAHDLESLPEPQGIAGITLTNAAAGELRRRVAHLGVRTRANVFLGTVHSFAIQRILAPFAEVCGRGEVIGRQLATRKQRTRIFREAIGLVYADWEDTRGIRETVERHRKMLATENEWALAGPRIAEVSSHYERILASESLTDFDSLISTAVDLVEENEFVKDLLIAKYPRIYVDEYQDLAPALDRIVRNLCLEGQKRALLFAVGDHNQAIYGWTGSRPELLHELSSHPAVTRVELNKNYRCARNIIAHASLLLNVEDVQGVSDGGIVEAFWCRAGVHEQAERAADIAEREIAAGTRAHEIGVLCPIGYYSTVVAEAFKRRGIPACDNASPYGSSKVSIFIEKLAAWVVNGDAGQGVGFSDLATDWRFLLRRESDDIDIHVGLMKLVKESSADEGELAFDFMRRLLAAGLSAIYKDPATSEDAATLDEMLEAFKDGGELSGWTISDLAHRGKREGRVAIFTVASCKGLEFDVSVILGAEEGMMPHFLSLHDQEKLAEDRRKFYVAVTRSRCKTYVLYSGFTEWGPGRSGRPSGPSRFLQEMNLIE
ncbi:MULTISPECIES: ATP-dependent helicase [Streptomyces]|uniref:ATP-dependent helicase n=1 Tax=Streptomyces TaxID=1883 RepID=UPI0009974218|nr:MULTISPECIES: ATP-dependent helicase [Streptomyces]MBZ6110596.1 ATP-dependent helicase [Streptomyces olivaceus]MBZ6123385.1 ATP-dependent helicase [Streptomyces olivaceus]MBZ6146541.1 ATP-dependent helicase [Streptomyces olivaceus]MBZ6158663.1 ATP-dependent helicase [Streptomyces olivaceus]MBZ6188547.1 ATP-dependent helicase [Streptomyces olivaceus]